MLQLRFRNSLSSTSVLALLSLFFILPSVAFSAQTDEGIRADLPSNGALRVENSRGKVSVEVWSEQYVSVSTTVEGAPPARSPVIIRRTEQQLNISITREPLGTLARINLVLKIPERARVEVSTVSGRVEIKGLPVELNVQTVSGDIRAEIPASSDAAITAQSQSHTVESALPSVGPAPERSERLYQARLGAGTKTVRLNTRLGHVALAEIVPRAGQQNSAVQI